MSPKFHLLFFASCFLLEEFAQSVIVSSDCYPEIPQQCDKDSVNKEWPKSKTRFLLFTRKNPKVPELLHYCNGTLPMNTNFNPNNKLVIFIPGFLFGTCEIETIPDIKDELLIKEDMNVILVVNVEEYGNEFLRAMENVEKVANLTVKVLQNIQEKTGIKNENVYIVGHSLGAQASGLVGQQFRIHRITALDPAGVTYQKDTPLNKRLDPDDADIVEVIHTNGGTGLPYLGAYFPMGDIDIYVNGGIDQPSCAKSIWKGVMKYKLIYVVGLASVPTLCSHSRVLDYYKRFINSPQKLVAYACKSYKLFQTGNCTGKGARTAIMGFNFGDSVTPEQMEMKFPRKYYLDTDEPWSFV